MRFRSEQGPVQSTVTCKSSDDRINRPLLEVERVSHNSGLSGDSIQRVVHPTVTENGEKAPALKFGQRGVMALFLARTLFQHLIDGFHNRDLRQLVADLLCVTISKYTTSQMTYDRRRSNPPAQFGEKLPSATNQNLSTTSVICACSRLSPHCSARRASTGEELAILQHEKRLARPAGDKTLLRRIEALVGESEGSMVDRDAGC